MVFKLIDIFKTKYFYASYFNDIIHLIDCFNQVREDKNAEVNITTDVFGQVIDALRSGQEVVIDIAEAMFTPGPASLINSMIDADIKVIDSIATWRNNIILENINRCKVANDVTTVELPEFNFKTNLKEYIKDLDTDVTYMFNSKMNTGVQLALFSLIIATRPSIRVLDDVLDNGLFEYVSNNICTADLETFSQFIMKSKAGLQYVDFSDGKTVFVQGYGLLGLPEALNVVSLIPKAFGTEVVLSDERFSVLLDKSLAFIKNFKFSRPKALSEVVDTINGGIDDDNR